MPPVGSEAIHKKQRDHNDQNDAEESNIAVAKAAKGSGVAPNTLR
jgi:hypothetical protein